MIYYIIGAVVILAVGFLIWRLTSVRRGARRRDEKIMDLLDPLAEKFEARQEVTADEVAALARQRHVRQLLYPLLKFYERLDLFPEEYLDAQSQAESLLAYWLAHPNEMEAPPKSMELVSAVERPLDGEPAQFFVFRFYMPAGHWAADDGWMLGVAGPYLPGELPYAGVAGAFSRFGDKYRQTDPEELVDWYIGMAQPQRA